MHSVKKLATGFTFMELVIVIAIVGVLAAAALPKFINITNNAQIAAITAISGALSSANASNYAVRNLNTGLGVAISNCTDVANAMMGSVPANYTVSSGTVAINNSVACTLSGPNSISATFTATGIA